MQWLRENREWHHRWNTAWPPARKPGPDGVTPFQKRAQSLLAESAPAGSEPLCWSRQGVKETYFTVPVPGTALTFWLYEDGVQISGPQVEEIFESGGYVEPEELLAAMAAAFRKHACW